MGMDAASDADGAGRAGSSLAVHCCCALSLASSAHPKALTFPPPPTKQLELRKTACERDGAHRAAANLREALATRRAAAELERASARAAGEAEAAARWQGRVAELRKQVGAAWGCAGVLLGRAGDGEVFAQAAPACPAGCSPQNARPRALAPTRLPHHPLAAAVRGAAGAAGLARG